MSVSDSERAATAAANAPRPARCTCTCTTEMARRARRALCPFCCELARAEFPRAVDRQGWVETLLDTIGWMEERHAEAAAQLREVWDVLGGVGSDVTQVGAARRVVKERDLALAERRVVHLVTARWYYGDGVGWTIERVCSSRAAAENYIAALPPEAYSRGDALWRYQVEEWPLDAAREAER